MLIEEFSELIKGLTYGKKLPEATYIVRPVQWNLGDALHREVQRAEIAAQPPKGWNLLKLHAREYAITFLQYPNFDENPHPELAYSTKINLKTGRVVKTDFSSRSNPPILHRKETFLPQDDSRIEGFKKLTKQEEEEGLYRNTSRIGLRNYWQSLLRKKGLDYDGHSLIKIEQEEDVCEEERDVVVERHRTAIKRYDLSKPVKLLLKHGIIKKGKSFFDFGCGHGMDIEGLEGLGYEVSGWDPAFRPDAEKCISSIVNVGYVLNVIERPKERVEVIRSAFSLCEYALALSVMVCGQENEAHTRRLGDGYITKTGTFQKFYAPGELESLVEETLHQEPVTLAPGICLVFRHPADRASFVAERTRRHVDWTEIGNQLRFSKSKSREESVVSRYELNREILDLLWKSLLELGRTPHVTEFESITEVRKAVGSLNRAVRLVVDVNGRELFEEARRLRKEDVLVYLAMTHFERRFKRKDLPPRIRRDIKDFYGDFQESLQKSKELLFASGDPDELELAIRGLNFGWYDRAEQHFSFHRVDLDRLPGILRVYVFCGVRLFGDLDEVDIIKIHVTSGKLTLHQYDDFDRNPLPELQRRIKIDLRQFFVTVFDHSTDRDPQLLFFKERFVARDFPRRKRFENYSKKVRELGLNEENIGHGPRKSKFIELLDYKGLNIDLTKKK